MVKKQDPSGGGTPWKGRLRSTFSRDEETRPFKNPGRCRSTGASDNRNLCRPTTTRVWIPPRRSPRLARLDPERQIVIDGVSQEFQVTVSKSAMTPIQRSTGFHLYDKSSRKPIVEKESCLRQPLATSNTRKIVHDSKTKAVVSKDKEQQNLTSSRKSNAAVKPSTRIKNHKEPQSRCQNSQYVSPMRKDAGVSCNKSEMQELNHSHCEVLAKKRKRGTGRMPTTRKRSRGDQKSLCQEIVPIVEPTNTVRRKSKKDPSFGTQPKIDDDSLMNAGENNEDISGIKRGVDQQICGSDDWTEEQDITLRQAYFVARPSPHFWKKVSKMVPGKSAEECFNRVHADLSTPTPIGSRRARTSKTEFSPLGHFTLSEPKFGKLLEPVGKQRTVKQKTLAAQKTVRHLLKKHSLMDQAQEADHFSIFETSPSALQLNISLEDSPGTPDNHLNLHKYSGSSSARKKPLSRLKTEQAVPSPPVLKPLKNVILHDKYIDQLSRREGAKKPRKKAGGTKGSDPGGQQHLKHQAGGLKAAKSALISEATDYINHFKKLQANSLAHVSEDSEDGEDNCI